jgi:hypothetical protein
MYLFLLYTARALLPVNFCVTSSPLSLVRRPWGDACVNFCFEDIYLHTDTTCPLFRPVCFLSLQTKLCFYPENARVGPNSVLSIAFS